MKQRFSSGVLRRDRLAFHKCVLIMAFETLLTFTGSFAEMFDTDHEGRYLHVVKDTP